MTALFETHETEFKMLARGKVRDIYEYAPDELLIVTSDRISAFDVILPTPIPGKGAVLTQVSHFWFERTRPLIANHIADPDPLCCRSGSASTCAGRSVVVRKARSRCRSRHRARLSRRARDARSISARGTVCGIPLPAGLVEEQPAA